MVHSHVYIEDVKFTKHVIPCGAIEEADEIFLIGEKDTNDFAVNLLGHGSIILVDDFEKMDKYKFMSRTIPEIINY